MMPLFADTSYFLALLNVRDQYHEKAMAIVPSIKRIVTTEWVVIEVGDSLAQYPSRPRFGEFRKDLWTQPQTEVIPLSMDLEEEGVQLYASRRDKEWSLTDCISFVVMTRRGLTDAIAGDHHFEQAGFNILLK